MMSESRIEIVNRFFSGTGSSYDLIVKLNTFGADIWWKKKIVAKIPEEAARIMDQGCGTGILTFQIARRFPRSRIFGVELREEYLNLAREKARSFNLNNVEFIPGRAEDVLSEHPFDCITSSYLAKYVDLNTLITNNHKMLKNGGVLILHDFTYPKNRIVAQVWEFYLRFLQRMGVWFFPEWREVYQGLPKFLRESRWVEEASQTLRGNGFSDLQLEYFTLGTSAILTARK